MVCAIRPFATTLVLMAGLVTVSYGSPSRDRTQVGHDIVVGAGEEVSDATCFGCSVRVRGHIEGDVTTFGGSVIVEDQGEINGDVTTFAGGARLGKDAKVDGDITTFGGQVRRDPAASVGGDISTFSSGLWLGLIFGLPFLLLGGFIALVVWIVKRLTRRAVPLAA